MRLDELPAQRTARGAYVRDFEFDLVFDDGATRHLLAYGTPLKDWEGQPRGAVQVLVDITDRKRAEEALRKSEQEFRTLTEAMPQIVWATRPDGWNIYFNQQWMDYTGLTLDESYGHGWNTPFHPDDKQRAWDAWQRATQHDENYLLECRLRRADGVYRWWLIHGTPMRGANGEILKWFGTCTDIDDRKRAEEVLRESEELLRILATNLISGVALIDENGEFCLYNPAFLRMFGLAENASVRNVNDCNWSNWQVFDEHGELLHVDNHPVRRAALTGEAVRNGCSRLIRSHYAAFA